ncbi:MAG: trimeric intracellular cation channel family protein [Neisseriaceae bacterium]|nr:trimeric intracellular cation channel family protein [Neisseriaceae bacterium]
MEYSDSLIYIAEIIGTIAFASSGALVAIRKNMDLLGVLVLGMTTALGGGLLRDLVLDIHPPRMFENPSYTVVAISTSLILFIYIYFNRYVLYRNFINIYEKVMNFLDALGLGIFTVVGINTALSVNMGDNRFLLVFVGMMTGVGGGLVRDILAQEMPSILVKQIYATASLIGAIIYVVLMPYFPAYILMAVCTAIIVAIRMLSVYFNWNLPKISE